MNKLLWDLKTRFYKLFRSAFPFGTILNKENGNLISLLNQAGLREKTVVDLGVGTGNVIQFLSEAKHVFGIDFTNLMLHETKANFPFVEIVQADALFLPIKTKSVDIITAVGLIEYIEDEIPFFKESCRILKNNGYLILTFSPANIWTRLRLLLGHPIYARRLEQITGVAYLCNFQIKDYQQSLMQTQILMQKTVV